MKKDYTQAVEAYKDACAKPSDEETRYNYALAKDAERKSA
jgi:hypothetical protein